jgi:DNA-binding MarR family transcriptional regulator
VSSPAREDLIAWRLFLEVSLALQDVLDVEMHETSGISLQWYDVLVHLEDAPTGLPMNELARRILHSKSGLTRVVDRMDEAGYVRRERPPEDRRVVRVLLTDEGRSLMERARVRHREGIGQHFSAHLPPAQRDALVAALKPVGEHARPLRPGRISG